MSPIRHELDSHTVTMRLKMSTPSTTTSSRVDHSLVTSLICVSACRYLVQEDGGESRVLQMSSKMNSA